MCVRTAQVSSGYRCVCEDCPGNLVVQIDVCEDCPGNLVIQIDVCEDCPGI